MTAGGPSPGQEGGGERAEDEPWTGSEEGSSDRSEALADVRPGEGISSWRLRGAWPGPEGVDAVWTRLWVSLQQAGQGRVGLGGGQCGLGGTSGTSADWPPPGRGGGHGPRAGGLSACQPGASIPGCVRGREGTLEVWGRRRHGAPACWRAVGLRTRGFTRGAAGLAPPRPAPPPAGGPGRRAACPAGLRGRHVAGSWHAASASHLV